MPTPATHYAPLDGAGIAYQVFGEGPPDLVLSAGGFNHAEVQWEDPGIAVFLRRLASFSRLIRFDMVGSGGSDRWPAGEPEPPYGDQLGAVLEAAGSSKVALIAMLDAAPGAIRYVVAHPDRVSHLVLYAATARMRVDTGYEIGLDHEAVDGLVPLFQAGWGTPAMTQLNVPSRADDPRFVDWYSKYLRAVGTPSEVSRRFEARSHEDVRDLLARVAVPTLVLHRRDYALIPVSHGRHLADGIPSARFVELPGADGPLFWESPDRILDEIEEFVVGQVGGATRRTVLTLVFTDIAGSTRTAERLGDREWLAILEQHDEISARHATGHGGRIVKSTGDGVLAAFASPSDAIRAAVALRDELGKMSVAVRTGIHAGEVEVRDGDVSGLGVHITSRVMSHARPGEILVSRTVRDLTAGSGLTFEDLGFTRLKGIEDTWQLYRLD